ncbi:MULTISPECIES: hypothetical protein [unclassified Deinococcus]|uniref:hypothetical protein n=1 Tax=unclassified Deinococcus TaxID=2623546 RepID=UPI000C1A7207|nr:MULTISPECIES: hypothetical protein [unclassified Deinococcus]MCD0163561.1 hypothetical protein [Deinococcus sp. 6YEL10]PIG99178.1 hypothetical protein AMD26_005350 [Deinococcus sp. UR1]
MTLSMPPESSRVLSAARSRRLARFPVRTDLLGLTVRGEQLHVTTPRGPLPLYRFTPLQAAVLCGERVPYAAEWPEHMKLFLYRYQPLPTLPYATGPYAAQLGTQPRDPHGLRPWDQSTYGGWPLYLFLHDQPGAAAAGEVADLFEVVLVGQPTLPPSGARGHGP